MKERPILFSAPMVRAILSDQKTMTRREVKPQPAMGNPARCVDHGLGWQYESPSGKVGVFGVGPIQCPHGEPGDRLWVRENGWQPPRVSPKMLREGADTWPPYIYDADGDEGDWCRDHGWKRRPSIHMPRWASRITLEVTEVRVERLNDISGTDAISEGIEPFTEIIGHSAFTTFRDYLTGATDRAARQSFETLWQSINGPASWAANSWVWVVKFQRIKP